MARRPRGPKGPPPGGPPDRRGLADTNAGLLLYNWANRLIPYVLVAGVLALAYLAWGVMGGHLAKAGDPGTSEAARFSGGAQAFAWSVAILALLVVIRYHDEDGYMGILLMVGGATIFAVPILINYELGSQQVDLSQHAGASAINRSCRIAGIFVLIVVGLRYVAYGVRRVQVALEKGDDSGADQFEQVLQRSGRAARRNVSASTSPFAKCWDLPYCTEYIRETCPRLKERKTCWRCKSGCHCDMDLLGEALGLSEIADATGSGRITKKTMDEFEGTRKVVCRECRIFVEHQRRKFRLLSTMTVPITAVLVFLVHPAIEAIWKGATTGLAKAFNVLSFDKQGVEETTELVASLHTSGVVWTFIVICGLFMLSGVGRLIEYLVLDRKVL